MAIVWRRGLVFERSYHRQLHDVLIVDHASDELPGVTLGSLHAYGYGREIGVHRPLSVVVCENYTDIIFVHELRSPQCRNYCFANFTAHNFSIGRYECSAKENISQIKFFLHQFCDLSGV